MKKLLDKTSNIECTSYRFVVLLFTVFVIIPFFINFDSKQASAITSSKNILILNSYHKEFTWTDNQVSAAKEVLEKAFDDLEIHVEYMDTKRIYTEEYLEYLSYIFRLKYASVKLDAIITTDDNALRFVMRYHKDIFGEAPVSFCGINDYNDSFLNGRVQFTGLIEVLDIKPTIDLALKLNAGTREVIVVVDSTPTGLGQLKAITEVAGQYKNLEFEYLEGKDLTNDELFEKLRWLPKDSICLLAVWLRDKNNEYLSSVMGGELIAANSTVPVYGVIDMYYGQGIVGGKLLNSATHGRTAAELAVRIIKGEKPCQIPVLTESNNPYMFDYAQLERWGLAGSDLPEGTILINKPFSFYQLYKRLIWSVASVFIVLIMFITVLFFNIIRRRQAEENIRVAYMTLKAREQELIVSEKKLKKQTTDLYRSNKELEQFAYVASHDLQEPLRMVASYVQLLEKRYIGKLDEEADEFIAFAVDGATRMQILINDLLTFSRVGMRGKEFQLTDCNSVLDITLINLHKAIDESGAEVTHDSLPTLMADNLQLGQLFQNLIGNAIKFRGKNPPQIHVSAAQKGEAWVFSVSDNGIGIDPEHNDRIFIIFQRLHGRGQYPGTGIGLAISNKITERHGGRIWVESQLGKGSIFYFTISVKGAE